MLIFGPFWQFWVIFGPFFGANFFGQKSIFAIFITFCISAGQAGSQLADSPVEKHHCGTLASGWMAEGHPTVGEGEVIRTVN